MTEVPRAQTATGNTMSGSRRAAVDDRQRPVMRPTIVAVLLLAGRPDWAEVRARVSRLTEAVPRLRSCAVPRAPGRGRPQFLPDASFDLTDHLRRIRLPEHGGLRDVLDLAQTMATTGFDPALPLWEAIVIEGVEEHRAAVVLKVHHALIDGVGGLAVLAQLFDGLEGGGDPADGPGRPGQPAVAGTWPDLSGVAHCAGNTPGRALTHPFRSVGALGGWRFGGPTDRTGRVRQLSPTMRGRSFRRHVEILDLDLGELHASAHRWNGTLNDVFVASVVRGLARYHDQRGAHAKGFRTLMPVNVRGAAHGDGGNHFVPARLSSPSTRTWPTK